MSEIVMTLSREERETYLSFFSELDAQFTGKISSKLLGEFLSRAVDVDRRTLMFVKIGTMKTLNASSQYINFEVFAAIMRVVAYIQINKVKNLGAKNMVQVVTSAMASALTPAAFDGDGEDEPKAATAVSASDLDNVPGGSPEISATAQIVENARGFAADLLKMDKRTHEMTQLKIVSTLDLSFSESQTYKAIYRRLGVLHVNTHGKPPMEAAAGALMASNVGADNLTEILGSVIASRKMRGEAGVMTDKNMSLNFFCDVCRLIAFHQYKGHERLTPVKLVKEGVPVAQLNGTWKPPKSEKDAESSEEDSDDVDLADHLKCITMEEQEEYTALYNRLQDQNGIVEAAAVKRVMQDCGLDQEEMDAVYISLQAAYKDYGHTDSGLPGGAKQLETEYSYLAFIIVLRVVAAIQSGVELQEFIVEETALQKLPVAKIAAIEVTTHVKNQTKDEADLYKNLFESVTEGDASSEMSTAQVTRLLQRTGLSPAIIRGIFRHTRGCYGNLNSGSTLEAFSTMMRVAAHIQQQEEEVAAAEVNKEMVLKVATIKDLKEAKVSEAPVVKKPENIRDMNKARAAKRKVPQGKASQSTAALHVRALTAEETSAYRASFKMLYESMTAEQQSRAKGDGKQETQGVSAVAVCRLLQANCVGSSTGIFFACLTACDSELGNDHKDFVHRPEGSLTAAGFIEFISWPIFVTICRMVSYVQNNGRLRQDILDTIVKPAKAFKNAATEAVRHAGTVKLAVAELDPRKGLIKRVPEPADAALVMNPLASKMYDDFFESLKNPEPEGEEYFVKGSALLKKLKGNVGLEVAVVRKLFIAVVKTTGTNGKKIARVIFKSLMRVLALAQAGGIEFYEGKPGIAEMADKIRTSFGLVLPAAVFDGSISKPTPLSAADAKALVAAHVAALTTEQQTKYFQLWNAASHGDAEAQEAEVARLLDKTNLSEICKRFVFKIGQNAQARSTGKSEPGVSYEAFVVMMRLAAMAQAEGETSVLRNRGGARHLMMKDDGDKSWVRAAKQSFEAVKFTETADDSGAARKPIVYVDSSSDEYSESEDEESSASYSESDPSDSEAEADSNAGKPDIVEEDEEEDESTDDEDEFEALAKDAQMNAEQRAKHKRRAAARAKAAAKRKAREAKAKAAADADAEKQKKLERRAKARAKAEAKRKARKAKEAATAASSTPMLKQPAGQDIPMSQLEIECYVPAWQAACAEGAEHLTGQQVVALVKQSPGLDRAQLKTVYVSTLKAFKSKPKSISWIVYVATMRVLAYVQANPGPAIEEIKDLARAKEIGSTMQKSQVAAPFLEKYEAVYKAKVEAAAAAKAAPSPKKSKSPRRKKKKKKREVMTLEQFLRELGYTWEDLKPMLATVGVETLDDIALFSVEDLVEVGIARDAAAVIVREAAATSAWLKGRRSNLNLVNEDDDDVVDSEAEGDNEPGDRTGRVDPADITVAEVCSLFCHWNLTNFVTVARKFHIDGQAMCEITSASLKTGTHEQKKRLVHKIKRAKRLWLRPVTFRVFASAKKTKFGRRVSNTALRNAAKGHTKYARASTVQKNIAQFRDMEKIQLAKALFKSYHNRDEVKQLLDRGALLNWHNPEEQNQTILHRVVLNRKTAVAKMLLREGASTNAKDVLGNSPLHIACTKGFLKISKALIAAGARADLKNVDGMTPRDIAEDLGSKKRAKMIAVLDAIDDKA